MNVLFSPSLMCMDLLEIKKQTELLNTRCDCFHIDIMDGHFVKNLTLSPCFVQALKSVAQKPLECHLMVTDPENYIEPLKQAGADMIAFHVEAVSAQAFRIINSIKNAGLKVGAVFNPATELSAARYYLPLLDKITIMTVDPGYAGQPFIEQMLDKIAQARALKETNGYKYIIEVDGSCNEHTFARLHRVGAECFVVGTSGLFSLDNDLAKAWDKMLDIYSSCVTEG